MVTLAGRGLHVLYYAEDGVVRRDFYAIIVGALNFYQSATDGLGGAEELDSKAAGDDDTVLGTLCRQRFQGWTALDGGHAQRLEVALVQRKELGVGRAGLGGVGLWCHGVIVPSTIPVADKFPGETYRLHFGQGTHLIAEGIEAGHHLKGFALEGLQPNGVGVCFGFRL